MSYSIKIIDNDNGNVLVDESESVAIVGSVTNKSGAYSIAYTACNPLEMITTLAAAEDAIKKTRADSPMLKLLESYLANLTDTDK